MSLLRELRPGRLYWRYKQRFGHGLLAAYYRDVVRWRILSTPPTTDTVDSRCEVHAVTSKSDWINLVWTLKSFYRFSDRRYSLCIHDDGTLSAKELQHLREHFPAARIIERSAADRVLAPLLADFPRSQALRASNPLSLKVFDTTAYLQSERMLLIDCDLLFFAAPTELLRRIDNEEYKLNCFNRDWGSGFSVTVETIEKHIGIRTVDRISTGLGLVHRSALDLAEFEKYLGIPGILSHPWRIEQTSLAIAFSRFGYEHLPEEYDVTLGPDDPQLAVRHYTGPIRHLMYSGGMRRLAATGFLHRNGL